MYEVKELQYREDFHDVCWEVIHDYREGCLCKKTCFNFQCYREALAVVADVLAIILLAPKPSDDGDDGAEP
ncbi:MAG: hypothetical protein SGPRY_004223 [Prymnesium sp.]